MRNGYGRQEAEQQRKTVMQWWRVGGKRKCGGIMDEDNRSALELEVARVSL